MMASLAQMERELIVERTKVGLEAARQRGFSLIRLVEWSKVFLRKNNYINDKDLDMFMVLGEVNETLAYLDQYKKL